MSGRNAGWRLTAAVLAVCVAFVAVSYARTIELKDVELAESAAGARDVAATIWFQGFLADSGSGEPVDATYDIEASIYDDANIGIELWGPEEHENVEIVGGWFNIELGAIESPLPTFATPPYYLQLTVDGEVLEPRLKLASVPSAFQAHSTDVTDEDWYFVDAGIAAYDTVQIGLVVSDEVLTVSPVWPGEDNLIHFRPVILKEDDRIGEGGYVGMLGGMGYQNLWIVNSEEDGWLLMGAADYPTFGVTDSTQFFNISYPFVGYPPAYMTVDGGAIGYSGAAIYSSQEYDGAHVLHAQYYGDPVETWATAVYGEATGGDVWGIGGEFWGSASGVEATAAGTQSPIMYGVYGQVDNTGGGSLCCSIYGGGPTTDTGIAYAGYFDGDVYVEGLIEQPLATAKIDHPLDPANEYLNHAFVGSPDMMNVYNGNVVLDASGEAVVELPEWFQELNRDFRYQLTCVGGFAPVYVADEISGNRFRIAGGEPGMKVSWMVTGTRQDAYAEANRFEVEERKVGYASGRYLHPEAFGLPRTQGVSYFEEYEQSRAERARKNAEREQEYAEQRAAAQQKGHKGWWRDR